MRVGVTRTSKAMLCLQPRRLESLGRCWCALPRDSIVGPTNLHIRIRALGEAHGGNVFETVRWRGDLQVPEMGGELGLARAKRSVKNRGSSIWPQGRACCGKRWRAASLHVTTPASGHSRPATSRARSTHNLGAVTWHSSFTLTLQMAFEGPYHPSSSTLNEIYYSFSPGG